LGYLLLEYRVHHHLKGGRRVSEPEEHDCGLEKSFGGKESSFPLISVFDVDVVISPSDIKLGEQCAPAKAIDRLGNEG
jgi:hypothetical protein